MMLYRVQITLLVASVLCTAAFADDNSLEWEETDQGVLVSEGERRVLFYQRATKSKDGRHPRANYVHPLHDLDGGTITEDFPDDHRHHRGVFWAWHQLRVGDQAIGDGWTIKKFHWDVRELKTARSDDGSVTLTADVDWKSPDWRSGEHAVVVEKTSIRVYPSQDDHRCVDFEIHIRATNDDTVIGGSDDVKGYGGFSVRVKMPKDITFTSQNGIEQPVKTAVAASPWMTIGGSLAGQENGLSKPSGLTILCHPKTVGYPQQWILRSGRSMQNPVWPGRDPIPLSTETPVVLRYRLVIHRGIASADQIANWHREYSDQSSFTDL